MEKLVKKLLKTHKNLGKMWKKKISLKSEKKFCKISRKERK